MQEAPQHQYILAKALHKSIVVCPTQVYQTRNQGPNTTTIDRPSSLPSTTSARLPLPSIHQHVSTSRQRHTLRSSPKQALSHKSNRTTKKPSTQKHKAQARAPQRSTQHLEQRHALHTHTYTDGQTDGHTHGLNPSREAAGIPWKSLRISMDAAMQRWDLCMVALLHPC